MTIYMINVLTVAAMLCEDKFNKDERKKCEVSLKQCYEEGLKADWAKKYTESYKKAAVFYSCLRTHGFAKL